MWRTETDGFAKAITRLAHPSMLRRDKNNNNATTENTWAAEARV